MPKAAKSKKVPAPSPYVDPKAKAKAEPTGPVWEAKKKNFAVGGDIQPRRDLSRYVRWPKYVRIQRQRKILYQRLKVPPAINQFTNSLDKNVSINLFKLLHKYRPEDKAEKKERLKVLATKAEAGEKEESKKKSIYIKFGINHIAKLCEQKKAQLVVIAHDVDPIEVHTPSCLVSPCPGPHRARLLPDSDTSAQDAASRGPLDTPSHLVQVAAVVHLGEERWPFIL